MATQGGHSHIVEFSEGFISGRGTFENFLLLSNSQNIPRILFKKKILFTYF